jgi:hypothetical protein
MKRSITAASINKNFESTQEDFDQIVEHLRRTKINVRLNY